MERQHKVKFNFLDDDIAVYKLVPPGRSLSLGQKINYITDKTLLRFSFIDSKSISISKIENTISPNPFTEHVSETLDQVTIDNYLTKGISRRTDGSFRIKPQQFGILPGLTEADVLQTMQQLPGIISVDETISNINVRGGTHDQNLFLWNGIRMFQTGHFFGLISAFNPLQAQEIHIYKNGTPANFGESVSSAVMISTKTDSIQKTNSAFETNMVSAGIYSNIKISDRSSFMISARRSLTDLVTSPAYRNYSNRIFQNTEVTNVANNQILDYNVSKKFYFYDFSVQLRQKVGFKNELTFDFIGISNFLDVSQNRKSSNESVTKSSHLNQQNYGANIDWKTMWNSKNTTALHFYGSYYNLDADNESVEADQKLEQQNTILDMGFGLQNTHQINNAFMFTNGYQYNETGIANNDKINNPVFSRRIKDVLRIHSLVLEAGFHPQNNLFSLKTGMRINYIEEFNKLLPEPRLQFSYRLSGKIKLEILGEIKSQTASQVIELQQDFLGIEKRRWLLSDNNENPIRRSRQFSAGITFKDKSWVLSLDNFYKKVTGITSSGQAFQNQLELEKLRGDYTVLGTEILLQKNFTNFYTWLSYSWNSNQYTFPDYIPPHFANNFEIAHLVSWAGVYEKKDFKIALGAKWYSGKPETTPLNSIHSEVPELVYHYPNNENLEDYLQVNLSASHKWKLNNESELTFSFSILNLLNKKNIINRYYRINTTENTIESVNTYSLERTPNVSIKVAF